MSTLPLVCLIDEALREVFAKKDDDGIAVFADDFDEGYLTEMAIVHHLAVSLSACGLLDSPHVLDLTFSNVPLEDLDQDFNLPRPEGFYYGTTSWLAVDGRFLRIAEGIPFTLVTEDSVPAAEAHVHAELARRFPLRAAHLNFRTDLHPAPTDRIFKPLFHAALLEALRPMAALRQKAALDTVLPVAPVKPAPFRL